MHGKNRIWWGLERKEGQGFADKLGKGKLGMRDNGETSYPLACISS